MCRSGRNSDGQCLALLILKAVPFILSTNLSPKLENTIKDLAAEGLFKDVYYGGKTLADMGLEIFRNSPLRTEAEKDSAMRDATLSSTFPVGQSGRYDAGGMIREEDKNKKSSEYVMQIRNPSISDETSSFPESRQLTSNPRANASLTQKNNISQDIIKKLGKIKTEKIEPREFLIKIKESFGLNKNKTSDYFEKTFNNTKHILRISNHSINPYYAERNTLETSVVISLSYHEFQPVEKKFVKEYEYSLEELTPEKKKEIVKNLQRWVKEGIYIDNYKKPKYSPSEKKYKEKETLLHPEIIDTPVHQKETKENNNMENQNTQTQLQKKATNYVMDKLSAAGIEVVTDKNKFDKILENENHLQKMASIPFEKFTIGNVSNIQLAEAKDVGLDLEGYKHEITNEFIAHVIKQHGNAITEAARGSVAITENDLKAIDDVINNPDRVVYGTTYLDFVNGKLEPRERIVYAKNMQDGTSLYFEEVLSGKKNKSLRGATLFKHRKEVSDEMLINLIKGGDNRSDIKNAKIKVREGVAKSPSIQQKDAGAVANSASHEPKNSIADFVDKSIDNYMAAKGSPRAFIQNNITYGFAYNGKIYLDPDLMNSNTPVHEYTHLWDAYAQKTNPELWEKGMDVFSQTQIWKDVKNDKNYADIAGDDNLVLSEVHARICGDMAQKILEKIAAEDGELAKDKIIDWDKEVQEYIAKELSADFPISKIGSVTYEYDSEKQKYIHDFFAQPIKDLMEGKNIMQNLEKSTTIQLDTKTISQKEKNVMENIFDYMPDSEYFVNWENMTEEEKLESSKERKVQFDIFVKDMNEQGISSQQELDDYIQNHINDDVGDADPYMEPYGENNLKNLVRARQAFMKEHPEVFIDEKQTEITEPEKDEQQDMEVKESDTKVESEEKEKSGEVSSPSFGPETDALFAELQKTGELLESERNALQKASYPKNKAAENWNIFRDTVDEKNDTIKTLMDIPESKLGETLPLIKAEINGEDHLLLQFSQNYDIESGK